jgi:hypothetical protein
VLGQLGQLLQWGRAFNKFSSELSEVCNERRCCSEASLKVVFEFKLGGCSIRKAQGGTFSAQQKQAARRCLRRTRQATRLWGGGGG